MASTVFDELERAWAVNREASVPVRRWADSPLLVDRAPKELTVSANRGDDREASEAQMAVLVRRAGTDELAALTVLHMLLPAGKGLCSRLRMAGNASEQALTVVETMWERIRTYPWQRRSGLVSGNVMADVMTAIVRAQRGKRLHWAATVEIHPSPAVTVESSDELVARQLEVGSARACRADTTMAAGEELLNLLTEAVRLGWLEAEAARLIGRCRLGSVPADVLAAEGDVGVQSLRRRRQRAEKRLMAAASA